MTAPTPFALLCHLCDLSQREAADFLGVRPDTVKSWSAGRNRTPDGVLDQLAALYGRIDEAAAEAVMTIRQHVESLDCPPDAIDLGLSTDDAEARTLGWPCVGAHRAVVALAMAGARAEGYGPFRIVPRGSTVTTAPAADAAGP